MTTLALFLAILVASFTASTSAHPTTAVREAASIHRTRLLISSKGYRYRSNYCSLHQSSDEGVAQSGKVAALDIGHHPHFGQGILIHPSSYATKGSNDGTALPQSFGTRKRDLESTAESQQAKNDTGALVASVRPATPEEQKQHSWNQLSGIEKILVGVGLVVWKGGLGSFFEHVIK